MSETEQSLTRKDAVKRGATLAAADDGVAQSEDIFVRGYELFIDHTVTSLEKLTRIPSSERIFSLRIVGATLMAVSLIFKPIIFGRESLFATAEFLVVFFVATTLLILGSYFRVKDQQEISRVVENTGKTFMDIFVARTGLL